MSFTRTCVNTEGSVDNNFKDSLFLNNRLFIISLSAHHATTLYCFIFFILIFCSNSSI